MVLPVRAATLDGVAALFFLEETLAMFEAVALLFLFIFLIALIILFFPRPSSPRRKRNRDDKPYWMDKRGY